MNGIGKIPSAYNKRRKHAFLPPCSRRCLMLGIFLILITDNGSTNGQADAFGNRRVSEAVDAGLGLCSDRE